MSIQRLVFASGGWENSWGLAEAGAPLDLERLVPESRCAPSATLRAGGEVDPTAGVSRGAAAHPPGGSDRSVRGRHPSCGPPSAPWELEIGFGKGRYLIRRAREEPEGRFLGIEMAGQYFRILVERARKRGLANLLAVRGEALYLLSAVLPRRFARAVHVYHPDPWPKARHQKRRLFDPETVDLVLGALAPGGTLYFATDHLDYGALVREILESHPAVAVRPHPGPWPDGARTNYEAKYVTEGREILRLTAVAGAEPAALHPEGVLGVVSALRPPEEEE